MEKIHILLFYKFVKIENPKGFQRQHLMDCKALGIKGRILVANEGINGSVSGIKSQINKYKKLLTSDKRFSDIIFKEEIGLEHPFRRMGVLLRDEIVALNKKVDLSTPSNYITSKELKELYDKGEDKEVIILDTRNDYEYKVGKFKNSIHLNIKTFHQFPEALKKIKDKKDKKIITFCTGGIRCEKAARYMKEQGFKDVYQLKDGILTFTREFPNTYWEGKCFVFDKRLVSYVNQINKTISNCFTCNKARDLYRNCRNIRCDKLYIQCVPCQGDFNGCCSKDCFKEFKEQCMVKSLINQGRRKIENVQ